MTNPAQQPPVSLAILFLASLCLGKKLRFQDLGPLTLKGFDEPVHAHAVAWVDAS